MSDQPKPDDTGPGGQMEKYQASLLKSEGGIASLERARQMAIGYLLAYESPMIIQNIFEKEGFDQVARLEALVAMAQDYDHPRMQLDAIKYLDQIREKALVEAGAISRVSESRKYRDADGTERTLTAEAIRRVMPTSSTPSDQPLDQSDEQFHDHIPQPTLKEQDNEQQAQEPPQPQPQPQPESESGPSSSVHKKPARHLDFGGVAGGLSSGETDSLGDDSGPDSG